MLFVSLSFVGAGVENLRGGGACKRRVFGVEKHRGFSFYFEYGEPKRIPLKSPAEAQTPRGSIEKRFFAFDVRYVLVCESVVAVRGESSAAARAVFDIL